MIFLHSKSLHYQAIVVRSWYWCRATKLPTPGGLMNKDDMWSYIIKSPGYDENSYPSQQLSFYYVKCLDNMSIQIKVHDFHLQECTKVYRDGNTKACVDYVKIADGSKEREYCGNVESIDELFGSEVLVTFRSSKYNNYKGFHITVRCTSTTQTSDLAEKSSGCLSVEGYTSKHYARMPNKEKNRKVWKKILFDTLFIVATLYIQIVPQNALKILMVFHQSFAQVMNGRPVHALIIPSLDISM